MTHYSEVAAPVFIKIKNGERLIEPRLYDPSHRAIRPGDLVIFKNRTTHQELTAKVVGVLRFGSFKELFQSYPLERFGATDERELLAEMRQYYSSEQEIECGVLGVKLHVLQPQAT